MKLKQIICLILAAAMLAAAGCGGPGAETSGTDSGNKTPGETESDTEAVEKSGFPVDSLTIGGVEIGEYTVVISSEKSDTYKLAYTDFINYIEKATGVRLGINRTGDPSEHEICIGETERDTERVKAEREKIQNDGYSVVFDEGRLYISGKTPTGTLNGVYSFLDDYVGCRFYAIDYEIVRSAERIDIPSDICVTFSPKFVSRDIWWRGAVEAPFAAKLKLNGIKSTSVEQPYKYVQNRFAHTLDWLTNTTGEMPCLTDEKTFEKALKNVKNLLKSYPDCNVISISQLDNYDVCGCDKCIQINGDERSQMGTILYFVNRIAEAIKDEYPNVYIETLAYQYSHQPPLTIKPADNVMIRFCTDAMCSAHGIGSGGCNKQTNGWIKEWSKKTDNIFIWDYTTSYTDYLIPFPNFNAIYENIQTFLKYNVKGVYEQGNAESVSGEFGELRTYLLAKLLWDPEMSRERYFEYMDDFLEGYYGSGWTYIREYIDSLLEGVKNTHIHYGAGIWTTLGLDGKKKSEKAERVAYLEGLWDKALEATDKAHYAHVEKSSIQIKFASCLADTEPDTAKNKALYALIQKYAVGYIREGKKIPSTVNYRKSVSTWYN